MVRRRTSLSCGLARLRPLRLGTSMSTKRKWPAPVVAAYVAVGVQARATGATRFAPRTEDNSAHAGTAKSPGRDRRTSTDRGSGIGNAHSDSRLVGSWGWELISPLRSSARSARIDRRNCQSTQPMVVCLSAISFDRSESDRSLSRRRSHRFVRPAPACGRCGRDRSDIRGRPGEKSPRRLDRTARLISLPGPRAQRRLRPIGEPG